MAEWSELKERGEAAKLGKAIFNLLLGSYSKNQLPQLTWV